MLTATLLKSGEQCSPDFYGFVSTHRSGNSNKCIGRCSNSPLKTDKPVPYRVQRKTRQRSYVWRGSHGFTGTLDTGFTQYVYPNVRQIATKKTASYCCSTMQLLFLLMFWSMAAQNLMLHLRYTKRYGFHQCSEPGHRNKCIRSCPNAPLKKRETLWFMPLFRTEFTQYAYR